VLDIQPPPKADAQLGEFSKLGVQFRVISDAGDEQLQFTSLVPTQADVRTGPLTAPIHSEKCLIPLSEEFRKFT
jgi:hypothetical protein